METKNITDSEYKKMAEKITPNSPIATIFKAFIFGGIICIIGQIIDDVLRNNGLDVEASSTLSSVALIFIGATLTALNLYEGIAKHAGAGSVVPITGFANSVVAPAIEFKNEGYVLGVGAKMFAIAGPVIVYGVVTSIAVGVVYFLSNA